MATPALTVAVATYNRADLVGRTIDAVLGQDGVDFEVVVVDDGSTDATPEVLAAYADERLRVVRKVNAGLGASRNTGLAAAEGAWVVFLDDDDVPQPGWLAALAAHVEDPGVGISCVGAVALHPDGRVLAPWPVTRQSGLFDGVVASYRAGTFAVRTDLCRAAGGYLEGLGTSHQFELFLRLVRLARERGLRVASNDANLLHIEWRPVDERRSSDPHVIYDATTWVMTRHQEIFRGEPDQVAAFEGVRGAAAARLGDWATARRHFRSSARWRPGRARHWGRLVLAAVPAVAHRAWHRHHHVAYDPTTVGVPDQWTVGGDDRRELFLAWGYKENFSPQPLHDDRPRASVRRLARRCARRTPGLVVDLSGRLERDADPVAALQQLGRSAGGAPLLLRATDREVADADRWLGPPTNPGHRREWSHDQLVLLLRSTGYTVERSWRRGPDLVLLLRPGAQAPTRVN